MGINQNITVKMNLDEANTNRMALQSYRDDLVKKAGDLVDSPGHRDEILHEAGRADSLLRREF